MCNNPPPLLALLLFQHLTSAHAMKVCTQANRTLYIPYMSAPILFSVSSVPPLHSPLPIFAPLPPTFRPPLLTFLPPLFSLSPFSPQMPLLSLSLPPPLLPPPSPLSPHSRNSLLTQRFGDTRYSWVYLGS